MKVIIKTLVPDYVPDCVNLRARISEYIITADVEVDNLINLSVDSWIHSFTEAERLDQTETKEWTE